MKLRWLSKKETVFEVSVQGGDSNSGQVRACGSPEAAVPAAPVVATAINTEQPSGISESIGDPP